jgi:pre-mRNA cleavage complex 2 protein Pcf11
VPPPASNPTAVVDPTSLLEKLRAAGMLPPAPRVTSTPPIASNPLTGNGVLPTGFPPQLPYLNKPFVSSSTRSPLNEIPNDVQLKPASLKM